MSLEKNLLLHVNEASTQRGATLVTPLSNGTFLKLANIMLKYSGKWPTAKIAKGMQVIA